MKTIIPFLLVLTLSTSINAQCLWDIKSKKSSEWIIDPFDSTLSRSTKWENLCGNFWCNINLKLREIIVKSDTSFYLSVQFHGLNHYTQCFDNDSKVLIKAGEGIVSVNLLGGIDCGSSLVNYGKLSEVDMDVLKKSPIDIFRIDFAKGREDIKIKQKWNSEYFLRNLKCFD
jgi:hypothetical protein